MSHQSQTSVDLSAIPSQVTVRERGLGAARARNPGEPADWRGEAERLRAALEEVVALACANAEARQRAVQMQRRAMAALMGVDGSPVGR